MDSTPFTYDLFAEDTAALLKTLGISKAAWIVISALLNPKIAPMVARGFTTGANHSPSALNETYGDAKIVDAVVERVVSEYEALQPNGNLTAIDEALTELGSNLPNWTKADLQKIKLGSKLTLSWGDHEEAINLSEPAFMHSAIPNSKLVLVKNVSHFGLVQDPKQFSAILENFLA
ncbi:hypothetical protein BN14_06456 [Rhizoctonia solani AG-1 IB]|uniref:Uncharacterized protein n=1 Tax=Thanatephorus cucumeris (strain AG1-IB / isolate 7/3/14) TaxID=1108050 RepID=M5BYW7_THACB|nr:hypothetical protein BN14_06456 [Rhizoctonia solani AG-1 IB]